MHPAGRVVLIIFILVALFVAGHFVYEVIEILHAGFATGSEMLYGRDPF